MAETRLSLEIDAAAATRRIEAYLERLVEDRSADGVVMGLSGGLDSAVLAALAVRALGKDRVHVAFLYERDSEPSSEDRARLVADRLGLTLIVDNIEPIMREKGIYKPLAMRAGVASRILNRFSIRSYRSVFGEPAFVSTLRRGGFGRNHMKRLAYNCTIRHIDAAFAARHVYRREYLEKLAREKNWLLLGAANRSECVVGWFVKDGIDDLPLSPIMGLYKTQVRQLADYLEVPDEVRTQTPSPDMLRGITDEFAIGVPYANIDIVFDGMERGLTDVEIAAEGVPLEEVRAVREIHRLSAWKRESHHEEPPVNGSTRGGLRKIST